jgi:chlorophyll synthase
MAAPQVVVIALLAHWDRPVHALVVVALLAGQCGLMWRLLKDPRKFAAWYNATGTTLYVLGMLASAFALRDLTGALS